MRALMPLIAASVLAGSVAVGQGAMQEVIVTAGTSKPAAKVGSWPRDVSNVTLSYTVEYADIDLRSTAGVNELRKRVNDTAMAVCKEIGRQYPRSTPDDAACAKEAAAKAMVNVDKVVAAVGK